ncbi:unnamed protein product, partial [Ascophyllum nodosum]
MYQIIINQSLLYHLPVNSASLTTTVINTFLCSALLSLACGKALSRRLRGTSRGALHLPSPHPSKPPQTDWNIIFGLAMSFLSGAECIVRSRGTTAGSVRQSS